MPGFLGGSTGGSSGTGGEILFPKEFIDPVTKLRISQPENLIDTDFEYGLQPTKWETVELINNTPSFFSKSGDTTIPNIVSIATNNGTREITVITATEHGLAVGIPINVTGTKSVTADGSYIINSIPNQTTFTYLCKDNQIGNNAIEDLYSSIITGEFFQGSQIRIADAEGITTNGEAISTLTVKTDSTHGFGLGTPFYFLNLNSTISQEFEASNTAAKSFDSSNSATAQTFDGSNTLSTFNIDWSNSATVGGVVSTISSVNTANDTITVTHTTETFANQPIGTPLYYSLTTPASEGFFNTNPRGVVFLKTTDALNNPALSSTFQVSATPDGSAIDLVSSMQGTFQLANQARTFAGNNIDPASQTAVTLFSDAPKEFDGANATGKIGNVTSYGNPNVILLTNSTGAENGFSWIVGQQLRYSTSGSAATGLTNNTTYYIKTISVLSQASPGLVNITIATSPTASAIANISGGTGTQTFTAIGVSIDRNTFFIESNGFAQGDMLKYSYPAGGNFTAGGDTADYYWVEQVLDSHNFTVSRTKGGALINDGSTAQRAAVSSLELKNTSNQYGLGLATGWYWLTLGGTATQYWVDMDYLGGGWMCVGSNYYGSGGLSDNGNFSTMTFAKTATTLNSITKTSNAAYGSGTPANQSFWVSLATWQANATLNASVGGTRQVVYYVANTYRRLGETGNHTQRARWNWTGWNGSYGWTGASGFTQEVGSITPGLWGYHINGNSGGTFNFSTIDADNDQYGAGQCSAFYTNAPWWYGGCWDGNFWGGGGQAGQGYLNAPYWTGSSQSQGDRNGSGAQSFHDYGAIYVR
jgi:hypothetical protein